MYGRRVTPTAADQRDRNKEGELFWSVSGYSALGHKQALEHASEMSALPTKADMRLGVQKSPLSAKSRHSRD